MIVLRRPLTIFDVDVIGVAVLLALAVTAYVVCVRPQRQDARRLAQVRAELAQARLSLQHQRDQLRAVQDQTRRLATALGRHQPPEAVPRTLAEHVTRVLAAAGACGLEVEDFSPTASASAGGGLTLRGTGSSEDLLRFLQACARREPYHAVEELDIRGGSDGRCQFRCTLRFFDPPAPGDRNDKPEGRKG